MIIQERVRDGKNDGELENTFYICRELEIDRKKMVKKCSE